MVNVRALPSDLARLVLDYLYSEGLQESYDVFLQESPHLEELRNFPTMGILPLGAKSLQVIVEEYYELTAQDTSKVKNANDALYKLWKRFDALLLQIKHHYKASGAIATVTNEMASQSVRSRYSLYRLHHERMQMEREQNQRQTTTMARAQPQHHQQHQQLQHHQQHQQQSRQQRHNSPFRRQQRQEFEPDTHHQMVSSPFMTNEQRQEGSCDTLSSAPRQTAPLTQEALSTSPSQSVTSTQSQFVTPTKISPSQRVEEGKNIGKSPKRKSAPPRRKPQASGPLERAFSTPSTSTGIASVDDIQNLPSPWGSLCNNRELMEKLADNINKVLPTQEMTNQDEPIAMEEEPPPDQANITASTMESHHSGNSSQALDDLLGGMVSESMMDEFVDMTSGDPAFNSLFALFNTDRDNFLSSERRKMQSSAVESDIEDNLNSSKESEVGSSEQQSQIPPTLQPNHHPAQQSTMPTSSQVSTANTISQGGNNITEAMGSSKSQRLEVARKSDISGTVTIISQGRNDGKQDIGRRSEVIGQSNISSTKEDRVFLNDALEGLSSADPNSFPNVVVRSSPMRDHAACTSTDVSSMESGTINRSTNAAKPSKSNAKPLIKASFSDFFSRSRIRELSFGSTSPPKEQKKKTEKTSAASQGTTSRRRAKSKASSSRVQQQNETTPSKKRTARTPERMYSPEEKAVARLLTKLPTTPTKESAVATSQSIVVDGRKMVIVRREKSSVDNHQSPVVSKPQSERTNADREHSPSTFTAPHNSSSVSGNPEANAHLDQVHATSFVVHMNGVKLSDLPGHSRTVHGTLSSQRGTAAPPANQSQPSVVETRKANMKPTKDPLYSRTAHSALTTEAEASASPAIQPEANLVDTRDGGQDIETVKGPSSVHSQTADSPLSVGEASHRESKGKMEGVPPENGAKPKKGVKRDRKEADKGKGSKKTKRSKSKAPKDLGFPINMDVDKFLSQVQYGS